MVTVDHLEMPGTLTEGHKALADPQKEVQCLGVTSTARSGELMAADYQQKFGALAEGRIALADPQKEARPLISGAQRMPWALEACRMMFTDHQWMTRSP